MASCKNPIWKFFGKNNDKAKCKFCDKDMSLGSKLPKKQTTSNIKAHLQKMHPVEYKTYCNEVSQTKKMEEKKHDSEVVQETLPKLLQRTTQTMYADDHTVSKNIDKSIMDLILVDMLPYNMVEGTAFKRLNLADPENGCRYRKKSEKFFRTSLMPETHEKVKEKVYKEMQKVEWLSFTTDIWSNPSKSCSLLSFTAHFIVGPNRLKYILGASVLNDDHTGEFI